MADFLIQATLSNLVVAIILAVIAWAVQRRVRSASLANLLWALVLIKMITPPLLMIPVFEVPSVFSLGVQQSGLPSYLTQPMDLGTEELNGSPADSWKTEILTSETLRQSTFAQNGAHARALTLLFALWLVISTMLLLVSAFRIIRFHWSLKANSRVQHNLSGGLSADVARQLGVRKHPSIIVATANIAPFVWWMAGRTVIVVSKQATQELNEKDLRLVITHEMAHIKRRDHWFRWLEWMALIGFWWNPVMWWARTQLRISEEMACDDLVLETAAAEIHQYANSLLNMAELLASSAIRPPVLASAINSGGNLEKRLKMMIAKKTCKVPSALRLAIVAVAICVFPLGVVYAQEFDAVERRLGGAVEASELSLEQAVLMMDALRRSTDSGDIEAKKRRYMEAAGEIEAAVKAGKVTKEDAEKRLIEMRKRMFRQGDSKDRDNSDLEAKKRKYMEAARKIEAAVKEGEVTKEDAEKRLIEMRKRMFRQGDSKDRDNSDLEAKKRKYMEAAREIEAAVKEGEVTKEDAEKRLIEMRKRMFRQGDSKDRDNSDLEAKKRKYMEAARKIEAAVKEGEVTKEDAEKRLIEMRKRMFRQDDSKDRSENKIDQSDDDRRAGLDAKHGERVQCLAIVLHDQRMAQKVWHLAKASPTAEYFGELAFRYSVEPASKANFGRVPPIQMHGGRPLLEKEASRLKANEMSSLVQVGEHWVILWCQGRTTPIVQDVRDDAGV